jgi:acetolactate decarboxylase
MPQQNTNFGSNSPRCCDYATPVIWQSLCASKFLGAAANGATTTPGYYSAVTRVGNARAHGNFGVGEFERLRGELFAKDNEFYQLSADGTVRLAADTDWLNFACLTFFRPTHTLHLDKTLSFNESNIPAGQDFQPWFDDKLPSLDSFYAFSLEGSFSNVVVSALPEQTPPYEAFSIVRNSRVEHTIQNDTGRMVAYFTPRYLACIGVVGYHFHFLNDARTVGGHVERFTVTRARIELQRIERLDLDFPELSKD